LMLDRSLRERLATGAELVPAKFSWENTVDGVDAIYQDVLCR
jgi:hypothetical protein